MTSDASFRTFLVRVTLTHMVTYTVAGLLAYTLIDYPMLFQAEGFAGLMRPVTSKWVAAGPALQVIRGLIFAMALYPFRRVFLEERGGWLPLWGLLLGLCVFSTAAAAPGSIEGLIYTTIPPALQMRGLPEVVLQTLAFSLIVCAWYRNLHDYARRANLYTPRGFALPTGFHLVRGRDGDRPGIAARDLVAPRRGRSAGRLAPAAQDLHRLAGGPALEA